MFDFNLSHSLLFLYYFWYFNPNSRSAMCDKDFFPLYCFDFFRFFFKKSITSLHLSLINAFWLSWYYLCGRDNFFFYRCEKKIHLFFSKRLSPLQILILYKFGRVGAEVKSTLQNVSLFNDCSRFRTQRWRGAFFVNFFSYLEILAANLKQTLNVRFSDPFVWLT